MAKELQHGIIDLPPHHGWHNGHEAPYLHLIACLSPGKSPAEVEAIKQEVMQSHTYLLICERGARSPRQILKLYQAEQAHGICGFIHQLMTDVDFQTHWHNYLHLTQKKPLAP